MIEPRPLNFGNDWADAAFAGAPLIETVLGAFVGLCQVCGRNAERQRHGRVLVNALIVDSTLYGDTYWTACFDETESEGPAFLLPPLN